MFFILAQVKSYISYPLSFSLSLKRKRERKLLENCLISKHFPIKETWDLLFYLNIFYEQNFMI